jgi:hypothetical protein
VLDLQIHDGIDSGGGVSRSAEQGAIAEAGVRGCLDHAQKLLNLTFDKCQRFAFGSRESLGLDFPGRIHGDSVSQENTERPVHFVGGARPYFPNPLSASANLFVSIA